MQGKVQKHQAFEAELSANQSRIDALEKAGQKLIDVKHYASDEVAARMNEVISLWKKLLEATELKGTTLSEEYGQIFREFSWEKTGNELTSVSTSLTLSCSPLAPVLLRYKTARSQSAAAV